MGRFPPSKSFDLRSSCQHSLNSLQGGCQLEEGGGGGWNLENHRWVKGGFGFGGGREERGAGVGVRGRVWPGKGFLDLGSGNPRWPAPGNPGPRAVRTISVVFHSSGFTLAARLGSDSRPGRRWPGSGRPDRMRSSSARRPIASVRAFRSLASPDSICASKRSLSASICSRTRLIRFLQYPSTSVTGTAGIATGTIARP